MKKIELLAPAGNKECFMAAINNGADAIYIGGKSFSARALANNFSNEEIKELTRYAHIHGVKVYVGINITLYENELDPVLEFIDFLYASDVDALIVSDFGLISILNKRYPGLRIHASTQMNTSSLFQVKLLEGLNVERVVLGRETSISTIQYILKNSNMEIEVFAHGALCVCYSGRCLHSSMVGKRSGNRGMCAQPCRMEYELKEDGRIISDKSYLLSTKDLNTLESIDKLIESGITSLKIEGRMKSPEYVGLVVKAYRHAIDNYYKEHKVVLEKDINTKLELTFSRSFTKGFIFNENNKDLANPFRPSHIGIKVGEVVKQSKDMLRIKLTDNVNQKDKIVILNERKDDIGIYLSKIFVKGRLTGKAYKDEEIEIPFSTLVDKNALVFKVEDAKLQEEIKHDNETDKKIPLSFDIVILENDPIFFRIKDDLNHVVEVKSDYIIEKANNMPSSDKFIFDQINRINNTAYYFKDYHIYNDNVSMVPAKFINELRKKAIEEMDNLRANRNNRNINMINNVSLKPINIEDSFKINVRVTTLEQLDAISSFNEIDTIYFYNEELYEEAIEKYPHLHIIPYLKEVVDERFEVESNHYLVSSFGDLERYQGNTLTSDIYLNVTNSLTIASLLNKNVSLVGISPEMSQDAIKELVDSFKNNYGFIPPLEMLVYGRIQTMVTKYCPISRVKGFTRKNCMSCKKHNYKLVDRKQYEFPILTDSNCNCHIYNTKTLHLIEYLDAIKELGISAIRLDFIDEDYESTYDIVKAYIDNENIELMNVTYGYFKE